MNKKDEAVKRMKALGLMRSVIEDFKKGSACSVYYSERITDYSPAVLYWLDNNEKYLKKVKDFEEKNNALVYHCILTHTSFGDLLDMLFVSNYEEEWVIDNEDIKDGIVLSNCVNLTDEFMSEMGSISVRPVMGGLERMS